MNDKKPKSHGFPCRPRRLGLTAFSLGLLMAGFGSQVQAALDLTVVSTTGAAIGSYKFIINEDNTGTTVQRGPNDLAHPGCSVGDPGYPGSCNWTSIAGSKSNAPVYTQGSQADIANVNFDAVAAGSRYLISVLADGYKIDGAHFTVTNPTAPPSITVTMQPTPLPDVTIQAAVFEDITPANSAPDLPAEHGLAGLEGIPNETLGQVTNDLYGNPLCSTYVNNDPTQGVAQIGGHCYSKCYAVDNGIDIGTVAPMDALGRCPTVPADLAPGDPTGLTLIEGGDVPSTAVIEGKVKIPHLGPNRYTLTVIPPNGANWVQTTTLEGNHDWDAWVMEGSTGLDTEFVVAGEPFPGIFFGFVPGANNLLPPDTPVVTGSGSIKGVVEAINVYWPPVGGTTVNGTVFGGMNGAKIASPQPWSIAGAPNRPWITVSDINNGDTVVRVTQGDANGQFNITGLPASTYTVTWWDERQNYILDLIQIAVGDGEAVDAGILPLAGWWTPIQGSVFNDLNRNGKRDSGEPGVANFPLAMKRRDNSVMDRGWIGATTDANGDYYAENVYPMTQWLIMEAYKDNLYTTGITYKADNGPETTIKGAGVDVNVLPIIGLGGRLDWGVHAYDPSGVTGGLDPRNGGIVGTITYDTTRNEYDPRYSAAEPWQPSIAGLPVNLYATLPCPPAVTGQPAPSCSVGNPSYELEADGSYKKGALINQYISETWERPKGCTARNVDGNPLVHGTDENVLPTDPNADCLEGPLMGLQFGPLAADQGTPDASFGASLDGNYGFGDACFIQSGAQTTPGVFDPATGACTTGSLMPLPARDYLVEVAVPTDAFGKPTYQVTREEDVNISNGDEFVPQIPPSACAGPLHTVDVLGIGTDGPNAVDNATFRDAGGSPYEGMSKPLCNMKLVTVSNGRSIAPTFYYFTEVPLPGRFWGLLVDNVNISSNPSSLLYGERPGVPFAPIGIYDYTNRLIHTTESDYNGLFDVLMPSTNRINCPTPSGVCANMYRFVGNDPGTPGNLNTNWNPQYQTIAAEFEAMPGVVIPADLAPATVGQQVQIPGSQTSGQVSCPLNDPTLPAITPELLAVSQPYVTGSGSFTIDGQGFGTAGTVALVNSSNVSTLLPTTGWSDTDIAVTVPAGTTAGAYQLKITNSNSGRSTVNALTFHVIGGTYTPTVVEVGPGKTYSPAPIDPNPNAAPADHTIQRALEDAPRGALVVVYPNTPTADPRVNPRGAYFENLVIHKAVKLQGVGPGGFQGTTLIPGSIIDGSAIQGDTTQAVDWLTIFDTLVWSGNQTIYEGAVISVYVQDGEFSNSATRMARIDGFDLRGGDQQGFPNNINIIGGGQNGQAPNIVNQAGAIFVNAYAHYLQITNNVIQNNGGGYGTLRIGTPNLAGAVDSTDDPNQHNDHIRIANNRVIANGGANLAGGIGIFSGSNNYEVANNDICGNSSVEYGGGMSVYGLSPLGSIHDNRVYLNRSLDEGGGIMIAGTLPNDPSILSTGVGGVDIFNNMIQANLSGDDGGGIRFLMSASKTGLNTPDAAGFDRSRVFNNIIVNNVSPHEGGGISFDDAANVQVYNNTIMKNITTATAITSNGSPAPAGLSTAANSQLLIDAHGPAFFSPVNFVNNIFWDNRAGSRSASTPFVSGIGLAGDLSPINYWDMGAADGSGNVSPTSTLMQVSVGANASPTNQVGVDPLVISQYDTSIAILPWRTNPQFTGSMMVALDLPPNQAGNYHLSNTSPAKDTGTAPAGGLTFDIDNQPRPAGIFDKGADEVVVSTDLSITKTDGATSKNQSEAVVYTIVVSNLGPNAANNAIFRDPSVANLTVTTVTCGSASGDATCPTLASTTRTLMQGAGIVIPSLPAGGSVTFTVSGAVTDTATGNLVNTASVSAPSGVSDADLSNNSATDTDTINAPVIPTLPTLSVLDQFNNRSSLGNNWRQVLSAITVRNNQAFASSAGKGFWVNGAAFGNRQGAALTFTSSGGIAAAPLSGTSLILKASGTYFIGNYQYFVRVRYVSATQVVVESTRNFGASYTTAGTINLPTGTTFANGNTLSAWVDASGVVRVFRTAGTSTYLGSATLPNSSVWTTRGGRIGMQLPTGARVDNFAGGNVP